MLCIFWTFGAKNAEPAELFRTVGAKDTLVYFGQLVQKML